MYYLHFETELYYILAPSLVSKKSLSTEICQLSPKIRILSSYLVRKIIYFHTMRVPPNDWVKQDCLYLWLDYND